jgi:hypothetical protein
MKVMILIKNVIKLVQLVTKPETAVTITVKNVLKIVMENINITLLQRILKIVSIKEIIINI